MTTLATIFKPGTAQLSAPCSACGQPVILQNDTAAKLAKQRGITCKDCLNTPQYSSAEHEEYTNSDHWKAFRKRALKYYGRKCYLCGTTEGIIDVHHNTYKRKGRELLSDVIPLCRKHHQLYEDNK